MNINFHAVAICFPSDAEVLFLAKKKPRKKWGNANERLVCSSALIYIYFFFFSTPATSFYHLRVRNSSSSSNSCLREGAALAASYSRAVFRPATAIWFPPFVVARHSRGLKIRQYYIIMYMCVHTETGERLVLFLRQKTRENTARAYKCVKHAFRWPRCFEQKKSIIIPAPMYVMNYNIIYTYPSQTHMHIIHIYIYNVMYRNTCTGLL